MSRQRHARTALGMLAALMLMCGCTGSQRLTESLEEPGATMDTLVTAEWLSEHLGDPDLVVLDCTVLVERTKEGRMREVNGRASYEAGHIPTAGFADLMGELSDRASPLQFAMPTPEQFAAAMGALGVGNDARVVLYDSNGMVWAARVWWMLRWIGFDRAALLDGGLKSWTADGRPLSTEPVRRPARVLTPAVRPELIADRDEVLAAIGNTDVQIIDALPEAHFRGEIAMYARPGHIADATNVSVYSLMNASGQFRPLDELGWLFDADREARAITYCGGGIAASANAFVMTRLGFKNVAVYAASLQEWAADPSNPMETGPQATGPGQ